MSSDSLITESLGRAVAGLTEGYQVVVRVAPEGCTVLTVAPDGYLLQVDTVVGNLHHLLDSALHTVQAVTGTTRH
jgi:hypothetical protein